MNETVLRGCPAGMTDETFPRRRSDIARKIVEKVYGVILLVTGMTLSCAVQNSALAAQRTFPSGSYIIPVEPCWQPNNDPRTPVLPAHCDTNKDDHGVFQAYGMVYDLLSNKVPVYWIMAPDKTDRNGIDFSVVKGGAFSAVQIIHSTSLTSSGVLPQADYRGGPFVIDVNDLTPEIKATAEAIIRNIYKSTKVHVANYDFSAPVDRVLSGAPPKVAVLGEGAAHVLLDYLRAAGLGSRLSGISRSITAQEIMGGVPDDFQLLWMPHWILETEVKAQSDRDRVLAAMRDFLEKGNAVFFECASIESIEGSIRPGGKTPESTGLDSQNSGGFLTERADKVPRVSSNGGSMDAAELIFEDPAFSLNQCAGWNFVPREGHMASLRPRRDDASSVQNLLPPRYNSMVTRFIHDRDDYPYKPPALSGPPGYDYFIGGRINGIATRGYAAYLAGHRYIRCTDTEQALPGERRFALYFDRDISAAERPVITMEAVHSGCRQGVDCPGIVYDISDPVEDASGDGKLFIQTEGAVYDPILRRLSPVTVGNVSAAARTLTSLMVTFPADLLPPVPGMQASLVKIVDSTAPESPWTICTPDVVSPAACTPAVAFTLASVASSCAIDWTASNTCGTRYVLNSLLGLQFRSVPNEFNKTPPVVDGEVLFKGTFEHPGYKGHLYAVSVLDKSILWDAGKAMPPAGAGNPQAPARTNNTRFVFTNIPGTNTLLNFEGSNAVLLRPFLDPSGTKTVNWARALINSVRGRKDVSEANAAGVGDVGKRLWGIEHSTPAVLRRSQVIRDTRGDIISRDRVVFAGAGDGMLHAFFAGAWDGTMNSGKGGYPPGSGTELWAYLPSFLLQSLQKQTFSDCNPGDYTGGCDPAADPQKCACPLFSPVVAVDSSPAIGDFLMDDDNDPRTPNVWKTVLVGTAVIYSPVQPRQGANQGIVFALDVTDPYEPRLLWERTYVQKVDPSAVTTRRNYYPVSPDHNGGHFPFSYMTADNTLFDVNMGNSKGAAVGKVRAGSRMNTYLFLTSNWIDQVNTGTAALPRKVWGLGAYALDLRTGDIVWETKILYTGDAEGINETPPIPALMDIDDTGTQDYVVFGDMQGRLWILRTSDGRSLTGDSPAFAVKDSAGVPMGSREPIGASVSVSGNYIVFGTGARDSLTEQGVTPYHIYALQVTPEGVTSLWKDPVSGRDSPIVLNPGEKVWGPPVMDRAGNIYIATGQGYTDVGRPDLAKSQGRGRFILADRASGVIQGSPIALPGAVAGGLDIENRHAYVITFDGTVVQIGGSDFSPSGAEGNPIKILWWKRL